MKKRSLIILMAVFLVFILSSNAFSALHTISISNLSDPSGLEAYNVWFDVSEDFALIGTIVDGSAIPPAITLGWSLDTASITTDWIFKIAKSNMDGWALGNQNNLLNGVIATFEYSGSINSLNFYQFGDFDGNEVPIFLLGHDQNRTDFSASHVPIPSALLLFGGGLLGIVGIRRKLKK